MSEREYWFKVLPEAPVPRPSPRAIVREVAEKHGLTVEDLKSPRRHRKLAWPRQEAMYELRQRTRLSFPQIGRFFGGRDHTTAIYGYRRHKARLKASGAISADQP